MKKVGLCLVNIHECSPYNNYNSNDIYMLTWTHNKTQQPYLSGRACVGYSMMTPALWTRQSFVHTLLSPRPSLF